MNIIKTKIFSDYYESSHSKIEFIQDQVQKIIHYEEDPILQASKIEEFLIQQNVFNLNLPEISNIKILVSEKRNSNDNLRTKLNIETNTQKIINEFEDFLKIKLHQFRNIEDLYDVNLNDEFFIRFGDSYAEYLSLVFPSSVMATASFRELKIEDGKKYSVFRSSHFYGNNAKHSERAARDAGLQEKIYLQVDDNGPFQGLTNVCVSLSEKYDALIAHATQEIKFNFFIEKLNLNGFFKKFNNIIDLLCSSSPKTLKFIVLKKFALFFKKLSFSNENKEWVEKSKVYLFDRKENIFLKLRPEGKTLILHNDSKTKVDHATVAAGQSNRAITINSLNKNGITYCYTVLSIYLPKNLSETESEKKSKEILFKSIEINKMFMDIIDRSINNHIEQKKQERILVAAVGREAVDNLKKTGNFGQTEKRDMYNHFADLVGFTDMSEKLHPELTGMIMNDFFDRMYRVMEKHGVTIDKFVGDQTMSQIHKKDMSIKDQTIKMFELSVDMVKEINEFNKILVEHYLPKEVQIDPLRIRIGFYHGEVIFGPFGRKGKMDYTAIGKPVNTAARYQSAAHPNHLVISEEAYQILLEAGVVQKHFEEITQHTECDAYKNAEIDDIFVPTSQRMKGIEKPHDIRMVLLDASYPKMISDQINHYLKDPAKGAYRIADIIFGLNKSGYSETILETIDKIDFYMIEWLIKELSKKYKLQFDFARDQIDETIIEKMSAIKHYHDVLTLEQARNPIGRLKHMVELRKKIVKPIRDDGYYEKDSGERKDVAKVLNDDIERDHQLLHLKQYHREVKMSFVRQLIKHQQHYRITKSLMRNVNGSFSRYENIEDLIFKTLISLNGLIVNKTPQELVNILMQKIGHLTVEKQKKAYVKYFSQIIGKALFAGKLSAVGLEKVKKAVLVP